MREAIISAGILIASYHYADSANESALYSVVLPIFVFASAIALAWCVVGLFNKAGIKQTGNSSGDFGDFDS